MLFMSSTESGIKYGVGHVGRFKIGHVHVRTTATCVQQQLAYRHVRAVQSFATAVCANLSRTRNWQLGGKAGLLVAESSKRDNEATGAQQNLEILA